MNLCLFTITINKLQIQTTCKIAELIEAGNMEKCLLHSNDIKIPLVIHGFEISFIFRLEIVLKGVFFYNFSVV